eukprot:TRINITY_DN391_c0_g1_i4.p1 TRINITY_DN391_c0_g1~~TRINITY_DN391_c0_g1_i4.p1  ORF type:complete len:1105 (+),score=173.93 TRINITY_DN391_c0_g1_i4:118-3432(+)
MRFILGLALTVAVHASYDSRSSTRMAVVDTHFADASTNLLSGALEISSGSVTLSRVASPPVIAACVGGVYGANFSLSHPPASPAARTEYFEFNFSGLSSDDKFAGIYIVFGTMRGADAPEYLSVSTSQDEHASVVATIQVPVGMHDTELTVPTSGQLPTQFTVRLSPANASANASNSCYLGIGNAPTPGRLVVYTGPSICPAAVSRGCHHERPSLSSRVRSEKAVGKGLRLHGDYGPWQCSAGRQADGSVAHDCNCNCFLPPSTDFGYDACSVTPSGHAFEGVVCAGDITVSDLAGAAALDSCDTINGDLNVDLTTSSAEAVVFPRLRRVIGQLEVDGTKTTSASFPLLQQVGELYIPARSGSVLTEVSLPRLQAVCGGKIQVYSHPSLELPMLRQRALSRLYLSSVPVIDIGSIGGGPAEVDEMTITAQSSSAPRPTVVEGFAALEHVWDALTLRYIEGAAGKLHWLDGVMLGGACGSGRALSLSIRYVDFGYDGSPRNLTLGLHEADSVYFSSVTDVVALLAPNACGSHWSLFMITSFSGTKPQEIDIGSVGGGPEIIGKDSGELSLQVSSSSQLPVFRGLSRLRQVVGNNMDVILMGLDTGGFPVSVFDAEYLGTGFKVDITYSTYDGPIAFPNLASGGFMRFRAVYKATSMEFPVITRFTEWYLFDCPDVVTLDIGGTSGGPTSVVGGKFVLYIYANTITTFRGLTALTSISGELLSLQGFQTAFPVGLRTAAVFVDNLIVQKCGWTDTDVPMAGVTALERLTIIDNVGLRAFRLPNLSGTMESITIYDNDVLEVIDMGSISGGPTSLQGSSYSGFFRIRGGTETVPHDIVSLQGLDNLHTVECTSTVDMACYVDLQYIGVLPSNLLNVRFVNPSLVTILHSHPSLPMAWDLNMTTFNGLRVAGCSNITALRTPALSMTAADYIHVSDNEHLTELDLGSVGGGPATLEGASWVDEVLEISGTATTRLETVRGLGSLASVEHDGTTSRVVRVSYVGSDADDLRSALERIAFPSGLKKRDVVVYDTQWTELRMAVTKINDLNVTNNCCLGVLRFPNVAGTDIGSGSVQNNPLLPDGCVDIVDTQMFSSVNRGGNLAATACPA